MWMTKRRAVAKRAKDMDRVAPGWYRHIDLDKLNLNHYNTCIVGQTNQGMYNEFNRHLVLGEPAQYKPYKQIGVQRDLGGYGLTLMSNAYRPAWKREIQRRLDADAKREAMIGVPATEVELATAGD